MENPNRFYTYAYLREDRTPYYIGKGTRDRIYSKNRNINLPKDKSRVIFLKKNLTENEAFKHEIYMIAVFGRKDLGTGILRNRTNGGEGGSGFFHSEETKQKLSELNKGKIISDETRRKMCKVNRGENNPNYGKKHSEETKRKMSEAQKGEKNHNYGKNHSEETKRKQSEALKGEKSYWYGKNHTEETKQKLSKLNKGKIVSNETRIKISEANKGKPGYWEGKCHSKETRQKMSESRKGENNPAYGRKWWNDGSGNTKYVKECPGEGWVLGFGKRKKNNKNF